MGLETTLFRAVGLNEASDLGNVNRFRLHLSPGFSRGKWFATTFEDAVRWGRRMQMLSAARPFRVAGVRIAVSALAEFEYFDRLDGIGPAYFVGLNQMSVLNQAGTITVFTTVYDVEALL